MIGDAVTMFRFYVAQLQPEAVWEFSVVLSKTGSPDPKLLADFSAIGTNPGAKIEPISLRLIPRGLETFLVENEVKILLFANA